ncbi:MAG: Gfo/Idh/MocA family oxidoreductase [Clostridia bacterium]|nr:Gfo/Idh/MocA family oxidoreductase [Clostridia bacterium]
MNIGIIGIGNRATAYFKLPEYGSDIRITALCDTNDSNLDTAIQDFFHGDESIRRYNDYMDLMACDDIDAVVICSPDTTHVSIVEEAMKRNKRILLEKPVATTGDDLIRLYQHSINYKKTILPGFVLRYTDLYQKVKEIVDSGEIGEIITLEANETLSPIHAASFFRRWHRLSVNNGGFLNAKCSHDLDLISMMTSRKPLYVSSFGSNIHFNHHHSKSILCSQCEKLMSCKYVDQTINKLSSADYDLCPYLVDSDIVDHQVVSILYEGGITASFTVSMHASAGNRMMTVYGSEGTIRSDFVKQEVIVDYIKPQRQEIYKIDELSPGHGGGDEKLCRLFIDKSDNNQVYDGIMSTAIALAAEKSRNKKMVISMKEFASYLY